MKINEKLLNSFYQELDERSKASLDEAVKIMTAETKKRREILIRTTDKQACKKRKE